MKICSNCGKEIAAQSKFCKFCGAKLEVDIKEISNENFETMMFTPAQIDDYSEEQNQTSAQEVFGNTPQYYEGSTGPSMPREAFNAGEPVYNMPNNQPPKKKQKPKKSPSETKGNKSDKQKIIFSIIAVLLVVAIGLTGFIIYKKIAVTDEEKLVEILEETTPKPIVEIIYDDFDFNNTYEAYAVVSGVTKEGEKNFEDADIYFVTEDGAELIQENVDGKTNGIISTDKRIFVSYEIKTENGRTFSYIYTANGSKPAESEASGKYSQVRQESGKLKGLDELGNLIDVEAIDKIKDIVPRKNNTTLENPTTKPDGELTTESPEENAFDRDLDIYKKYFANGGIDEFCQYCDESDEVEVNTCMIDMNDDGSYELIAGVRREQLEFFFAVLAIQNGNVVILYKTYGGGSGGGEFLSVCKDTITSKHVVKAQGFAKDGYRAGEGYNSFLIYDGTSITVPKNFESGSFIVDYFDYFDKLKQETTVYTEEDGRISWYKVEGIYVTEAEYNNAFSRYSDEVSPEFEMKQGTYYNPMPY